MGNNSSQPDIDKAAVEKAAEDPVLISLRRALATSASTHLEDVGRVLYTEGYVIGTDRATGKSPFGHGSDETVAVSLIALIASELTACIAELFEKGKCYAASALLRQMVELEYLAWAFDTRNRDAERWIRSNSKERQDFFRPSKLRDAASGLFRGKDYGYHCDLGGHPTPTALILLRNDATTSQMLLSDLLGHVLGIWNHIVRWARQNGNDRVEALNATITPQFVEWKARDPLTELPPPP